MLFGGVLLWPLWPFRPTDLRIPLAILALIALYMAHRAKARHLFRPSNSIVIPGEIIARSDALPVGDSPATNEPITASGEQLFQQDGLVGWAMLGLLCGAMPSSMMAFAIGPLPIVCLAIGQPILLKQWIIGPVRWFIWTVVAGIGGYFLGGVIGIPLGFSGHVFGPMIGTTVSIGIIALAQFFCLSPDGRDALKYWIPLNIFAVALITITGTVLLQVSNFKGAEFFQFFKRHLGASDYLASLLHSYMFSIPQFLILCLALGCYVRWATSGSDHRNGDS
jgi:hypothetical protein